MVDAEYLKSCLRELLDQNSSKVAREVIETLLTIHRNILEDEEDLRFRKLKPANPTFSRKVWNYGPARNFMYKCGWVKVHELLVFNSEENLEHIINVLLEYRMLPLPEVAEWKEETKFENINYSQVREEELRRKAAIEREKELQEYQKDKIYRQQLIEEVKAQIVEDILKNKKRYTKPVVDNKLNKRAKLRPFSSLVSMK